MKFRLPKESTNYLNDRIQLVLASIVKKNDIFPEVKTLYKMRGKFAPNSLDIYLTKKERTILEMLLNYRQQSLIKNNSISDEVETIDGILNILQTEAIK